MKNIFLLLTLLIGTITFAQEIEIEWGETNDKDAAIIQKIFGQDSNQDVYAVSATSNKLFLEIYSPDLNRTSKNEIELPKIDGKKIGFEEIFMSNDQITLFASHYVDKVNTIYAYKLSKSGKLSKKTKVLDMPVERKSRSGKLTFHQEPTSSNLLVGMFVPKKKEKKQLAEFILFDIDLNTLGKYNKRFPYADNEDDRIDFVNAKFDKDDNVYILTASKERQGKVKTVEYSLNQLSKSGESKKMKLGSSDKPIEQIDYQLATDGSINIFGFYLIKKGTRSKGIEGIYIEKVSAETFESINKKVVGFTYSDKKLFLKDAAARKDKAMPKDFVPLYYFENPNGSITMIAERRLVTVSMDSRGNRVTRYLYQDVMLININENSEVNYIQDIDKRQAFAYSQTGLSLGLVTFYGGIAPTQNRLPYMSFMPIQKEDGSFIFLYNDNPKNVGLESDKRKTLTNMKKGLPMMAIIDKDGNKTVDVVFGAKDDETIFRTTINLQISNNEYFIYGSKLRKDKLGKITVN